MTGYQRTLAHPMASAHADRRRVSRRRDPAVGMAAIVAVALAIAMLLATLPGMAAVHAIDIAPAPLAAPHPGPVVPSAMATDDGSPIDEGRGR